MRYLRNAPTRRESYRAAVVSTAVAAGVGIVVFYFTRLFRAREPVGASARVRGASNREADQALGELEHGAP